MFCNNHKQNSTVKMRLHDPFYFAANLSLLKKDQVGGIQNYKADSH